MKSVPELLALLDEARDYVIVRGCFRLDLEATCSRLAALRDALNEMTEEQERDALKSMLDNVNIEDTDFSKKARLHLRLFTSGFDR